MAGIAVIAGITGVVIMRTTTARGDSDREIEAASMNTITIELNIYIALILRRLYTSNFAAGYGFGSSESGQPSEKCSSAEAAKIDKIMYWVDSDIAAVLCKLNSIRHRRPLLDRRYDLQEESVGILQPAWPVFTSTQDLEEM